MNREHYAVTEIMQMTGDFTWAAGHGKWLVPPQAEGFSRAQRRRQSTASGTLFSGSVLPALNDESSANVD